ncbi:MAG: PadR family transcriptional regulator [Dehalococcoidia bacterium]|jgi:DNA-binding PadR family transcriptional regulator
MFRFGANLERHSRRPWRDKSFQKGDLKYVILDLLKEKPRHGYEVIRELEAMSHGFYTPSPGAVYPTLQMLEEMGYAEAAERDGKKIYTITEAGLKFLDERQDSADEVRSQMKRKWSFKNVGKMAGMMKDYHNLEHILSDVLRSQDTDKMQRVRQILDDAYKAIEDVMAE